MLSKYASDNGIIPFKNILIKVYAKDFSRKIKSAYQVKFERGDYQGVFAPFGYVKDPNDKCKLIADAENSEMVKLIFDLAKQADSSVKKWSELVRR